MAFISSDDEGEPQHDPSDADEVYDSGPPSEGLSTPTREPALDAEPSDGSPSPPGFVPSLGASPVRAAPLADAAPERNVHGSFGNTDNDTAQRGLGRHAQAWERREELSTKQNTDTQFTSEAHQDPHFKDWFNDAFHGMLGSGTQERDQEKNLPEAHHQAKPSHAPLSGSSTHRPNPYKTSSGMDSQHDSNGHKFKGDLDSRLLEDAEIDDKPFYTRVALAARSQLFYTVDPPSENSILFSKPKGKPVWVLNLATMQRMNIHCLQRELVNLASYIYHNPESEFDRAKLEILMRNYCQAWKDWGFMEKTARVNWGEDPFKLLLAGPQGELTKKLVEASGFGLTDNGKFPPGDPKLSYVLPGSSRQSADRDEKIANSIRLFWWAIGGGLSLIAPMLLMRLHNTLLTQLLTAGGSVFLFALGIASLAGGIVPRVDAVNMAPQDVLTATAAYAAVLVVFISQSS